LTDQEGADAMRKRAKQETPFVLGLAWYRAEDWSTPKAMFPDGDQLEPTHAKWLAYGENVERRLRRDGHVVKRILIDPAVFRGWCLLRGVPMDAKARTQYAAERVRLEHTSQVIARGTPEETREG
jgi:hypothetical protein